MSSMMKLRSFKSGPTKRPYGLRKLSPDLIGNARDDTVKQSAFIGQAFLGAATFCLLSLFTPDIDLLGSKKVSVPLVGPVSFFGLMLVGPALLIVLRIYLQIYVEHSRRLDQLAKSMAVPRAPTLVPRQNLLMRVFNGLIFYTLLPVTVISFAWKAAVFPVWGASLFGVSVAIVIAHALLSFKKVSWRLNMLLSVSVAAVAGVVMFGFGPLPRSFDLFRANLSHQWLQDEDLRKADLRFANLSYAHLEYTNLSGASMRFTNVNGAIMNHVNLSNANLSSTNLDDADLGWVDLSTAFLANCSFTKSLLPWSNLSHAHLMGVDLSGAMVSSADLSGALLEGGLRETDLSGANLSGSKLNGARLMGVNLSGTKLSYADLSDADLSSVMNLTSVQLDEACGNKNTKLPKGLVLKPCSTDR